MMLYDCHIFCFTLVRWLLKHFVGDKERRFLFPLFSCSFLRIFIPYTSFTLCLLIPLNLRSPKHFLLFSSPKLIGFLAFSASYSTCSEPKFYLLTLFPLFKKKRRTPRRHLCFRSLECQPQENEPLTFFSPSIDDKKQVMELTIFCP